MLETCFFLTHRITLIQSVFPCTDPFQPCHQGMCRPDHCSWWWAGWQGWRAPPHPRCPLSWSCWWTPRCSCRSHRTSRTSLSSYALNVGCVQPLPSRKGQKESESIHLVVTIKHQKIVKMSIPDSQNVGDTFKYLVVSSIIQFTVIEQ